MFLGFPLSFGELYVYGYVVEFLDFFISIFRVWHCCCRLFFLLLLLFIVLIHDEF